VNIPVSISLSDLEKKQDKCSQFEKRLLVSEAIKAKIEDQNLFNFTNLGDIALKGKAQPVGLYEVSPC
jgi:hypothetical protein